MSSRKPKERRKFTPRQLAALWGIAPDKVLAWIRSGELKAINGCTVASSVPRYLIDINDIEDFERRRCVAPAPAKPSRRRRRKHSDLPDYF